MTSSDTKFPTPASASLTDYLRNMADTAEKAEEPAAKPDTERIAEIEGQIRALSSRMAELEHLVAQRRDFSFFPQGADLDTLVLRSMARLQHLGPATVSRIAADTGIATPCVTLALEQLAEGGRVICIASGPTRRTWVLPRPAAH